MGKKAAFHVVGDFQAHMCIALQAIKCVMMSRPTQDPCVSFRYTSPKNTLCIPLMMSFSGRVGVVGKRKQTVQEIWALCFVRLPSAKLHRIRSPTLRRFAPSPAHNTSSRGILWGGGASEPWNYAGIHHHQRSVASCFNKMFDRFGWDFIQNCKSLTKAKFLKFRTWL